MSGSDFIPVFFSVELKNVFKWSFQCFNPTFTGFELYLIQTYDEEPVFMFENLFFPWLADLMTHIEQYF